MASLRFSPHVGALAMKRLALLLVTALTVGCAKTESATVAVAQPRVSAFEQEFLDAAKEARRFKALIEMHASEEELDVQEKVLRRIVAGLASESGADPKKCQIANDALGSLVVYECDLIERANLQHPQGVLATSAEYRATQKSIDESLDVKVNTSARKVDDILAQLP